MTKAGKRLIKNVQDALAALRRGEDPFVYHNPIAKDLRTPKYKPRVVQDKTKYNRKGKNDLDSE